MSKQSSGCTRTTGRSLTQTLMPNARRGLAAAKREDRIPRVFQSNIGAELRLLKTNLLGTCAVCSAWHLTTTRCWTNPCPGSTRTTSPPSPPCVSSPTTGPADLTWKEAAAALSTATGTPIQAQQFTDDDQRAALRDAGMGDVAIEGIIGMAARASATGSSRSSRGRCSRPLRAAWSAGRSPTYVPHCDHRPEVSLGLTVVEAACNR